MDSDVFLPPFFADTEGLGCPFYEANDKQPLQSLLGSKVMACQFLAGSRCYH
uniref:Uncharacterized protein n=1 Tax=Lotus japonicus TaxID=34305 RepID=I3T6J1_LOTJA|nr:unknown [Lotus japonicus]